jgi:hypothetical protein
MLEALIAWQDDPEGCDELTIRVDAVGRDGDDFVWTITCLDSCSDRSSNWLVRAHAARGVRLDLREPASRVELADTHPLLLPHAARRSELYVRNGPADPSRLLGDLWRAHRQVTGGWIPTDAYLNGGYGLLSGEIGRGFGQLAAGPRPLLEAYAEVARDHGMQPNLLGDHPPVRWEDGAYVEQTEPLHVLLIGDSWGVAERFTCERRP